MVVFYPLFVDPANPTVERVADHIEYIARITGKKHVGIGSDFDGMPQAVRGLEDASKYPNLVSLLCCKAHAQVVELLKRGWTDDELADLLGNNLLRILDGVDRIKDKMATMPASPATLPSRPDLPVNWGGGSTGSYLPQDVRDYLKAKHVRDEL